MVDPSWEELQDEVRLALEKRRISEAVGAPPSPVRIKVHQLPPRLPSPARHRAGDPFEHAPHNRKLEEKK